jgi:hypothetical protein
MENIYRQQQNYQTDSGTTFNQGDYDFNSIHSENIELETEVKSHSIIINSKDRNWTSYTNETPYNFSVKLGGSSSNKYSIIPNEFKNISYIEVKNLILSDRTDNNGSNVTTTKLSYEPYIHCVIKNLNRTINGTNSIFDSSMGIFTPNQVASTTETYNYITFNNSIGIGKYFTPIPLNTIQQLDIQLLNTMGQTIKNKKDVLDIKSIYINNETDIGKNDYLIIKTSNFFDNNEFKIGDTIQCKNYQYHDSTYTESYQFNDFMNSSNCHTITNISKTNDDTELYDQIHIQFPSSLSRVNGNLTADSWFLSFLTKSLDTTPTDATSGKLINLNTQSHLVINIETLHNSTKNKYFNHLV